MMWLYIWCIAEVWELSLPDHSMVTGLALLTYVSIPKQTSSHIQYMMFWRAISLIQAQKVNPLSGQILINLSQCMYIAKELENIFLIYKNKSKMLAFEALEYSIMAQSQKSEKAQHYASEILQITAKSFKSSLTHSLFLSVPLSLSLSATLSLLTLLTLPCLFCLPPSPSLSAEYFSLSPSQSVH